MLGSGRPGDNRGDNALGLSSRGLILDVGDDWSQASTSWDPDDDGRRPESRIVLSEAVLALQQLAGVLAGGGAGEVERELVAPIVRWSRSRPS